MFLALTFLPLNKVSAPKAEAHEVPIIVPEAVKAPVAKVLGLDELVHQAAVKYGVSEETMRYIIKHESSNNPTRVGDLNYFCKRTGKIGPSYGLVQINSCWHPEVSYSQAMNMEFSINFLAKALSQGKCYEWSTCPQ